ncbi:TetR/AcrR family transcriptional regulator [Cryptosporangium phraense]|uniref:Helix-turn-helix transcriptional regulator n=1 Tax=Cryptosporangium phraense TaxID=2593070 RepID=A0A545AXU3_9ACTN|nr:helix-turn-helix domain-containing protein [Cryptosporangium phraense]TQS46156.1 helix-turn-helix transcriptional regulator [Cryptosporangium phraense]
MAGQLRADAQDNRSRILAVARAAFAADGLEVPIREIARQAGVGPATVYRHFPTKEALLAEAFADERALCSEIVAEGLAAEDPWDGFSGVILRLLEVHALNRGFSRAFNATLGVAAERDRSLRGMLELIRRAKLAGALRSDFVLEDAILALMANEGIRAESPAQRAAASRRFGALMLQSFRAIPDPGPLPPPVRLPLAAR